jgi:hypothetical protein
MTEDIDDLHNNAPKMRGRPFEPGDARAGRPKGSRHKITVLAEKLLSDDVEGVVQSVIKAAKNGDMTAARVILDRIAPPRKDSTISIELPDIKTLDDVAQAMSLVVKATASAEIGLSEADMLTKLLQGYSAALEATEITKRLDVLEQKVDGK